MSSHNQWNIIESFSSGIRGFSYLFIHLANIYWAPTMCTHSHRYRGKTRKSLLPPIWGESREDRWQQTETIHNSAESVSALLGGGRIWEDFAVDSFDQKPEKTQGMGHICLKEGHFSKCQVRPWGGSLCLRKSKETGISRIEWTGISRRKWCSRELGVRSFCPLMSFNFILKDIRATGRLWVQKPIICLSYF